jgi:glycosyltransferase involved in cell wall biosynthesis
VGAGRVVRRDVEELASAVTEILQSPERAKSMRAAGRRFATSHLAWERIAHQLNTFYNQIIHTSSLIPLSAEVAREC